MVKKILIISGFILGFLLIIYFVRDIANVFLLFFAGILLAVFLSGIANFLSRKTFLSRGAALAVTVTGIFLFFAVVSMFAGPRVTDQMALLIARIPEAIQGIKSYLMQSEIGKIIWSNASKPEKMLSGGTSFLGQVTGVFSTTMDFVINFLIIIFMGIYLAVDPKIYIDNAIRLLPKGKRERARNIAEIIGRALGWWLVGRISSMIVVGILTAIGLMIIGMPLALSLGLIAALMSFIPYIGPILSAVPAILVGLAEGPVMALYVVIVYIVVQFLESYFITPLIQKKAVSIPPALLISMQILMGILIGAFGVFLATPLLVTIIVLIQTLYVEDVLHDKIEVLGDHD